MPNLPHFGVPLSNEQYLTILLLALLEQCEGELRISARALDSLDKGARLVTDWDVDSQQLIIRRGSTSAMMLEVSGWQRLKQPQASPAPASPPSSHRVMTEDRARELLDQRRREELLRTWRTQGAEVLSEMPEPSSPESEESGSGSGKKTG